MSFRTSPRRSAHAARGVTLIELMIAVAIVGILAAIAYPSYQAQVRRGNRTDAKAELMEASQELEKCFTRFGTYDYDGNAGDCIVADQLASAGGRMSEAGKYRLTFLPNTVTATTYTIQAVLMRDPATDPECVTLRLDQTGGRTHTGTAPTPATCWR